MAKWLKQAGCPTVQVLQAETFNTKGELTAFYQHTDSCQSHFVSVLTAPYHWRRMRHLIRHDFGQDRLQRTSFIACDADRPTMWERLILEPLKLLLIYLPRSWRSGLVRLARAFGLKS